MRTVRYSKKEGEEQGEQDLGEALAKMSDFFLRSRNNSFYDTMYFQEENPLDKPDSLAGAIQRLIEEGALPQQYLQEGGVQQLLQQLQEADYVEHKGAEFELTEKGLDLVSQQALRELLASLGRHRLGRHQTRHSGSGAEMVYETKEYEFGDPLQLNVVTTLLNAAARRGTLSPLEWEFGDLAVYESEFHSNCATVLMLDTSHSMILYGEDRFTPAKRVTLALAQLIKHQYPGDELALVLFHDEAERISPRQLARVKVGPYYTNTREGLRLAQAILAKKAAQNKQIIMITDGKPSMITEEGRTYRDAWGLNPFIVAKTLEEVRKCRNLGISINTFMLARDSELVEFVKEVTRISNGRAYFTTPQTLGHYLMVDYLTRKSRQI